MRCIHHIRLLICSPESPEVSDQAESTVLGATYARSCQAELPIHGPWAKVRYLHHTARDSVSRTVNDVPFVSTGWAVAPYLGIVVERVQYQAQAAEIIVNTHTARQTFLLSCLREPMTFS